MPTIPVLPILPALDPASLALQALKGLLMAAVVNGDHHLSDLFGRILFSTGDLSGQQGLGGWSSQQLPALTANPTLRQFTNLVRRISEALLVVVVMYAGFRTMWERTSFRARYSLKTMMPRLLGAVVLIEFSDRFCQMAIDLDNALVQSIFNYSVRIGPGDLPGNSTVTSLLMAPVVDPFLLILALIIVAALVILALSYVVRYALICVLVVTAPAAALVSLLPETRHFAQSWTRLFSTTVLMQPAQILLLKLGTSLALVQGTPTLNALYALAVLYLMLKVPGALSSSSHLASKGERAAHHLETSVKHLMAGATRTRRSPSHS